MDHEKTPWGRQAKADESLPRLTARARRLALWLSDVSNPALVRETQAHSLRELTEELGWPAAQIAALSQRIRTTLTRRYGAPYSAWRDWLVEAGWMTPDRTTEQLPPVSPTNPPRGAQPVPLPPMRPLPY